MPFRQTIVSGFPAIALRTAELEVVVVPSLGMKLSNLRRPSGREWLWRNPQLPFAAPVPGVSYVDAADSGGWDECFPTVAASAVPGDPDAPPLPDHGELWSARWESSIYESGGAVTVAGTARGARFPYEFSRDITLDAHEPLVRIRYRLRHTGGRTFPWIWSSHPLLNVQPGSTLELPGVTQVRVDAAHRRPDLDVDDLVSWPGAVGGSIERFEFPPPGEAGWALKLFADASPEGKAVLTDPHRGERLEFAAAASAVPQVGIWINCAGWAPSGKEPYYNLALEPCIGAPDSLDRAARAWGLAHELREGEERTWEIDLHLLESDE